VKEETANETHSVEVKGSTGMLAFLLQKLGDISSSRSDLLLLALLICFFA